MSRRPKFGITTLPGPIQNTVHICSHPLYVAWCFTGI